MADSKGRKIMKLDLRGIIQGCCMIGIFLGILLIDANLILGARIIISCIALFALLEKGDKD